MELLKNTLKVPHLWIILAIMTCGAVVYYADQIPLIQDIATRTPIILARYSTHRILSLIPVAYAAAIFRFYGGVITVGFISLALLPRALFFSSEPTESIAEITAFLFIGLLVSWLIDRQQRAVNRLEKAQRELQSNVKIIQENDRRLSALNQISTTVSQSLELGQILSNATDSVISVMQVDAVLIYLRDEESGKLTLVAHRGVSDEFVKGVDKLEIGEGFIGRVAESGESLFVEDASQDARLNREAAGKYEVHSALIVPLTAQGRVSGTICVTMHGHRQFQQEEADLLTAIGNQIGVAVHNAYLYQRQQIIAQQLGLSEERYRGLFENSSEAIFVCSTTGRVISANKACEQLTGYSQSELSEHNIYELFSGASLEHVKQFFPDQLEKAMFGQPEEFSLVQKGGAEAFVQLKFSRLFRDSQLIGLQVIARNVTEERQLRQNMEYYMSQITRAQEDERLRMSRELHDETAQIMASLSRGLNSLVSGERKLSRRTVEQLEELHQMADSALEKVRRFGQDLRPSILDDLGLVPALEWLVAKLEEYNDIETKVNITGNQRRLQREKELTVFRITQEALNNVRRHSRASTVELTVDFSDDALTVIISDNGQGFEMPPRTSDLVLSGKLGIIGMRERARLAGGTLIVQSETGSGTTITLRMPD